MYLFPFNQEDPLFPGAKRNRQVDPAEVHERRPPCSAGQDPVRRGELANFKLHECARRIGYVPQGLTSAFPFRVKDIIVMGRAPHLSILASPSKRDMDMAYEAMETTGISHLADRPCNAVSGGEWQLTLIARSLVQKPQILLLDEPTSHLDLGNQMRILQVIKELTSDGMTIIMASHFPDHAFLVAHTVAILNKGKIVELGAPDDVITEENLRSTYGVEVRVVCAGEPVERKVCFPALKKPFPIVNTSGLHQ